MEERISEKEYIQKRLFEERDLIYQSFLASLIPNVEAETIIGVRAPMLKKMAKELRKENQGEAFFRSLPHTYYEENSLQSFWINECKDYEETIWELDRFLPFVDNWATCDSLRPKTFRSKKNRGKLKQDIGRWMASDHVYTRRFAIEMVMTFFLEEDFDPKDLETIAAIRGEDYYLRMMLAWFFATALAKQWESTLPYLTACRLNPWVHNKTIQKAVESYRISPERKEILRSLRMQKEKKGRK